MKGKAYLYLFLGALLGPVFLNAQEQAPQRRVRKPPEQRLVEGVMANDFEMVRRMILGAKLSPDATYGYSLTPLQIAVSNNNMEIAQFLIRRKADINLLNNRTTALHIAAEMRHFEMIKLLMSRKVNVSVANSQAQTPLQVAAQREDMQVMQALMVSSNLREITASPLMLAVARNQPDRVKTLLDQGLVTYNIDKNGYLPLHYAAVLSTPEMLQLLLPYYDINARTYSSYTALMLSSKNNRADLIPILLKARANIAEKDSQGNTPLHHAVITGAADAAKTLVRLNAPTREVNGDGLIPLDLAKVADIKAMLRACYDLPVAVENGNTPVVQRLLRQGAYVNIAHTAGNRPLHIAVEKGHLETAQALITAKANVNVTNDYGNAPIHIAASSGNMQMLDLLVKSRARINDRNRNLELPIQLAIGNDRRDAVILLKNLGSELYDGVNVYLEKSKTPDPAPLNTSASLEDVQAAERAERLRRQRSVEAQKRIQATQAAAERQKQRQQNQNR